MRLVSLIALLVYTLPAQSQAVLAALATGSYFPLDVGDRWVYRIDDRFNTATYQTWRVDRTVTYNGASYSAIDVEGPGTIYYEAWFRADSSGRIYILTGDGDALFLDPGGQSASSGQLIVTGRGAQSSPFGTFPDALHYSNRINLFDSETGVLARGLGLLTSTRTVLAGSSGGPDEIRTLVEASVAGGIHFPATVTAVQLGIDSLNLDVTGKKVTNCAIPCYFAACQLVPGADPPGTYRPCAQVRVELASWPAGADRSVHLQFTAADGTVPFDRTMTLDGALESVLFVQLPLYSAPNQPLPGGSYQLSAKTVDGTAQASLAVRIQ
jgi:hypothetical protein